MKILFYNHTGQISGAEYMLLLILSRLNRTGFEPLAICPSSGGLRQKIERLNVRCETIDDLKARFTLRPDLIALYLISFVRTMRRFREIVKKEQPDLIHANSTRAGLVATAATVGLRPRVVWHLHDVLPAHPISSAIRFFARRFKRVSMIAVSRAVETAFRGNSSDERLDVRVIHNGIEMEKFARDETGAENLRAELQISADQTIFGIVGQLTPRKGQLELIHAFSAAARIVPNAVLLIVGAPIFNRDHEYQKELTYAAQICGIKEKVIFTGKRADVAAVFSLLDAAVVNSVNEPFGLVLIEAMAAGTPVLATAVDGVPELITHQKTGWLVPSGDTEALTAAIVELSREPELRRQLGEQGKAHVQANFRAEKYISAVEKYFDERFEEQTPLNLPLENQSHQI